MKKIKEPSFKDFLKIFPEIELPYTLNEDDHHTFSLENKPLPEIMIQKFIRPFEQDEIDEFTEYIPCFRLPQQGPYFAVVFWRAKLLDYHYMMHTYQPGGGFIQSVHIAGTRTDGERIAKLFCHIKEDATIHLIAGSSDIDGRNYEPTTSKAFTITMLEDGTSDIEMDETLIE